MPYAVLSSPDPQRRRAVAEDRWTQLTTARPETLAAVALQRELIGVALSLTEAFERTPPPRLSLPPRYLTTKLRSGIPALTAEPIPVPVAALRPSLLELARILAGTGGEAARAIHEALDTGRLDAGALLTLAVRREQAAIRAVATRLSLGHDLVWLVADLASGPYAHMLLGSIFDAAPSGSALRDGLDAWGHGYCPLCGSWPSFLEAIDGRRRLRCSFCAAAWELANRCCIYCGVADDRLEIVVPDAARPARAVEICNACRGYAKATEAIESLPFPLLPLADFESMDLDVLAMQKGCGRPAVKTFARRP